jgi:hypothetical protein
MTAFFAGFAGVSAFGPIIPELKQPIDLGSLSIGVENDKLPFPASYPYVKTAFLGSCRRNNHTRGGSGRFCLCDTGENVTLYWHKEQHTDTLSLEGRINVSI